MLTLAMIIVFILLFIFTLGIDVFLYKLTFFDSIHKLFELKMKVGKSFVIFAAVSGLAVAMLMDYRRNKRSNRD